MYTSFYIKVRKLDKKSKIVLIVKVFLTTNKGKWFTSKQLCDFINNNDLNVRNGVNPTSLSRSLNDNVLRKEKIDRRRRSSRNVWEYGVVV